MTVAHQFRVPSVHSAIKQHGTAKMQAGLQLRHVQVRALSGAPLPVDGGKNRGNGELGANKIGVRTVGIHRAAVGPADDIGVTGQGRQHGAETGLRLHGAAAPQHGCAEQHNTRVHFAQLLVTQPPALQSARRKVLGDHVGPLRYSQDQLRRPGVTHVDGQAILVSVVVGEISGTVDTGLTAGKGSGPSQCFGTLV